MATATKTVVFCKTVTQTTILCKQLHSRDMSFVQNARLLPNLDVLRASPQRTSSNMLLTPKGSLPAPGSAASCDPRDAAPGKSNWLGAAGDRRAPGTTQGIFLKTSEPLRLENQIV